MNDKTKLNNILKLSDMIKHLKEENIKFDFMSEEEAFNYLKYNDYYYNISSYKNNFSKYQMGKYKGKYIDLAFAYLKDLSIIDYEVRMLLFKIIMGIEHYLKLRILNIVNGLTDEDGYNVINLYFEKDFNDEIYPKRLHNSLWKKANSEY